MDMDTIAAIATAPGEGGVGIVRISGPRAFAIAEAVFVPKRSRALRAIDSHTAVYGKVIDPSTKTTVDEALLLWMKAPRSYTCEDVIELQCHGGSLPLRRILSLVLMYGARLAEPGEFTKRAFLNGRLDLAQAQAVIDIIQAKSEAALKMSVGHLEGQLSGPIGVYRDELLRLIAQIEAKIDFPEEEIEVLTDAEIVSTVQRLADEMELLLQTAHTGRILRDGMRTVLAGRPNVGKSSLLNALLREERAIVTDIPGTTRDAIEEYLNVGGVPLRLVDTAGIRETDNPVEQIGVERSRAIVRQADLILLLLDSSEPLCEADKEILALARPGETIVLCTKADLPRQLDCAAVAQKLPGVDVVSVSSATGTGLNELEKKIFNLAYGKNAADAPCYIRDVRQEQCLRQAQYHLREVVCTFERGLTQDFLVIDLRAAWEKLGEITGDMVSGELLDEIFSRFCIGK